jgi:hypothetical protein
VLISHSLFLEQGVGRKRPALLAALRRLDSVMLFSERLVFACGTGSRPTYPAIRRSLAQKLREKYTPKWAATCQVGLWRKFCMAGTGTCADFAIARFDRQLFEPAATCAPAPAPPSPHIECKEVQYQCDYLHTCNIFAISAISVPVFPCPFAPRLVRAGDGQ